MRKFRFALPLALLIVVVAIGGYAAGSRSDDNDGLAPRSARGTAAPAANAKFARAAAMVDNEGPTFLRSKGFKSVTSPSPGIYCLKLKDPNLHVPSLIPMVTTEWGNSGGNDLLVQVYRAAADCPARNIQVQTFHMDAGSWVFYDNLSFYIMVP